MHQESCGTSRAAFPPWIHPRAAARRKKPRVSCLRRLAILLSRLGAQHTRRRWQTAPNTTSIRSAACSSSPSTTTAAEASAAARHVVTAPSTTRTCPSAVGDALGCAATYRGELLRKVIISGTYSNMSAERSSWRAFFRLEGRAFPLPRVHLCEETFQRGVELVGILEGRVVRASLEEGVVRVRDPRAQDSIATSMP